jgi:hypothetical protein
MTIDCQWHRAEVRLDHIQPTTVPTHQLPQGMGHRGPVGCPVTTLQRVLHSAHLRPDDADAGGTRSTDTVTLILGSFLGFTQSHQVSTSTKLCQRTYTANQSRIRSIKQTIRGPKSGSVDECWHLQFHHCHHMIYKHASTEHGSSIGCNAWHSFGLTAVAAGNASVFCG